MEGDLLVGAIPASGVIAIVGAALGIVFGMLRWFAARLIADIDARLSRIDEIEKVVEQLRHELPAQYMRRDDFIRELGAINAKLDRLYEHMLDRR